MKIVAIGDTHGRDTWKSIVDKEMESDKIIFIRDFFDSRDNISADDQIKNFNEIIKLKELYPDKFILLIGNHDHHYRRGISEQYSGYERLKAVDISEVLEAALSKDLLQMCFIYNNFIFTHAGITKTWLKSVHLDDPPTHEALEQAINSLSKTTPRLFNFTSGERYDNYGNDVTQTPIWVRPESLAQDKLDGFTFVVGHTQVPNIEIGIDLFKNIVKIDTLGYSKEYLIIDDGELKIEKI